MSSTPGLGRDVDAYCSSCKMVLAHTVTAKVGDTIKRVLCNTCKKEHAFHGDGSTTKRSATGGRTSKGSARPKTRALTTHFDTLLAGRSVEDAVRYTPKVQLTVSDLVQHPRFGLGVVSEIKAGGKAEVVFPEQVKVLIFGR